MGRDGDPRTGRPGFVLHAGLVDIVLMIQRSEIPLGNQQLCDTLGAVAGQATMSSDRPILGQVLDQLCPADTLVV
jgi:hypothetical protein